MKKIVSAIMTSILAFVMGLSCIVASAEVSDVKINCEKAKEADNSNKSLSIPKDTFQIGRITEDTQVVVSFDIIKGEEEPIVSPVNLVIQCFDDPDNTLADSKGGVWATIAPKSFSNNSAIFYYSDIVKGFTSKDFSKTEYLHVIATTNYTIKVTNMVITACNDKVPETTTTTTTTVAEEKTTEAATTQVTTTAAATVSEADNSSKGSSTFLLIGGIAAGVILTIVIVFVIMNKKSSEAFDVSTGEFINKKNLFEPSDTEKNSDTKKK